MFKLTTYGREWDASGSDSGSAPNSLSPCSSMSRCAFRMVNSRASSALGWVSARTKRCSRRLPSASREISPAVRKPLACRIASGWMLKPLYSTAGPTAGVSAASWRPPLPPNRRRIASSIAVGLPVGSAPRVGWAGRRGKRPPRPGLDKPRRRCERACSATGGRLARRIGMANGAAALRDSVAEGFFTRTLAEADPEIARASADELTRERDEIELIASENIVSRAVLEAQGSVMTNKYAEGSPGKRYYGGCEYVDVAEALAIERAKRLFGCAFANVQPHSGAQANGAVMLALLSPGDTILGMSLDAGGHLTHGARPAMSGKWFNAVQYGVSPETYRIDYEQVRRLAEEHRPKLIIAGYSAYPRALDFAAFRDIADSVGALLMVDMAHIAGIVAAGRHENPVRFADVVTSTTHKTLRGPRGGFILTNKGDIAKKINSAVFPGLQGGPLMHVIAGKAVAFGEALRP